MMIMQISKASYVYNGKVKTPKVVVKNNKETTLKNNVDYTVSVPKGRKEVGKYTYNIKFKGEYRDTRKLVLTIKPGTPVMKTLKSEKSAITVKWGTLSTKHASGYEVKVATNSNFNKNVVTKTVVGHGKSSLKLTKLKAKTGYKVKVRAYKKVKVNGVNTKICSDWSKNKSCKTR